MLPFWSLVDGETSVGVARNGAGEFRMTTVIGLPIAPALPAWSISCTW